MSFSDVISVNQDKLGHQGKVVATVRICLFPTTLLYYVGR